MNQSLDWSLERGFIRVVVILAIFIAILYFLRGVLLPFILGAAIALPLNYVCTFLENRGRSRNASAAIVVVGLTGILLLTVVIIIPFLITGLISFFENFPVYANNIFQWVSNILPTFGITLEQARESVDQFIANNASSITSWASNLLLSAWQGGSALFNYISLLLVTPVVVFYILKEWYSIRNNIKSLIPVRSRQIVVAEFKEAESVLSGFIRGQIIVSTTLAIFYGVTLQLIGLNFGFGFGILAGFISAIPVLGGVISLSVVLFAAVVQFAFADEWVRLAAVPIAMFAGQILENSFLTPRLIGERINVHPVWLIFGVLAAGSLFGIIGVIVAVPVTALAGVLIRFMLSLYKNSSIYQIKESDSIAAHRANN